MDQYTDVPDKPRLAEQIGYLSRDLAEEFAARMDNDGWVMMAEIFANLGFITLDWVSPLPR